MFHRQHRDASSANGHGGSHRGRVLVVDDQAPNRALIRKMLARDGHDVLEAGDGHQALALAREADPDVVVLDVLMPGLDGFETCATLKAGPETRLTPVVLVTALKAIAEIYGEVERGWRRRDLVDAFVGIVA